MKSVDFGTSLSTINRDSILIHPNPGRRFRTFNHTGKRVSIIRWLGSGDSLSIMNYNATEYFVTGTWGERENEVCLWKLHVDEFPGSVERAPQIEKISPFPVIGNVADIVSLGDDKFAFVTSKGVLAICKVMEDYDEQGNAFPSAIHPACASQQFMYKKTKKQCPATGIATNGELIVTVGEDGSIYQTSLSTNQLVQAFENIDPLSLSCVQFLGREQIITGNIGGQVKVYDLRSSNPKTPVRSLYDMNELSGVKALAQHSTQNHMLLIGYESGRIEFQDLRQTPISQVASPCEPVAYLPSQKSGISEIYFHRLNPDHFFTTAQNGELVHWVPAESSDDIEMAQSTDGSPVPSPSDLTFDFLKFGFTSKVLHSSPFPMNSLSVSSNNRLICGGDSGVVFCTELSNV